MRRWSLLFLTPLTLACAAVLGLEEATVEDDDDGSGDIASRAGRAGSNSTGGAGSGGTSAGSGGTSTGSGGTSAGSGGGPSRGGTGSGGVSTPPGGQGGAPMSCDPQVEPSTCVGTNSVRYCNEGTFRTAACSVRCPEAGYDPGTAMCSGGICQCGDYLDPLCADGMEALCTCAASAGAACTNVERGALYSLCYWEDPDIADWVLCYEHYYYNLGYSCDEIAATGACPTPQLD